MALVFIINFHRGGWMMRVGLLAVVTTVVAVGAAVTASPAAGWAQEPVVLSVGHTDALDVHFEGGQLELLLKDDTGSSTVVRDPADVILQALPSSAVEVPDDPRYGFLGEPGETIWVLPQAQDPALLWPGWSTERLPGGTFVGNQVTLTLVEVAGPGAVSVFTVDPFGNPVIRWRGEGATVEPDAITVPIPTHAHANWAFDAQGEYTLTFQADATLSGGGSVSSGPVDYTFAVGELGGGDPDPPALAIHGMRPSYQPGATVELTAVQSPQTELDDYRWFSLCPEAEEWAEIPGETAADYAFTATLALDGCQYQVRLFDGDHTEVAVSPPVTLHVDEPGGEPDLSQLIIATIDESDGVLVVSVDPDDRTVVLPPAQLSPSGDRWQTAGDLRPVTVTDTRAGAPGWNVSGQVGEFTGESGSFAGSFLGWSPEVLSQAAGQGVEPGAVVPSGFEGGDGLATSRGLGSAPSGDGLGTARLGAGLALQLPTQTPPGEYTATLTLTAI
jgi:surface-anchored protein